jgi:hypothetical protein
LVQLSASDWSLMLSLPRVVSQALLNTDAHLSPERCQILREALARYTQIMQTMQGLVRFDAIALIGQQATAQRDVLAIQLNPMHFAQLRLPVFEFQVQINKTASGHTQSAHLIFDEKTVQAPFLSWVSNVPSTGGQPVMALRLTPAGWDTSNWSALVQADQDFVQSLVGSLTIMLITLQVRGARVTNAWQDWFKMAATLRQWSRQPLISKTPISAPQADVLVDTPVSDVPDVSDAPSEPLVSEESVATPKKIHPPKMADSTQAHIPTKTVNSEKVVTFAPMPKAPRGKGSKKR